ncbi:peptidase M20 [Pullulanibacillus camelliae]|uniref:Peptidase M20 n=1 Tax=Pullulanibacillus camelliae TaxID=1707096 RepID=A0A8J2VLN8_9BACL|nr:amidohydrolase [Pullulanibacillus camelliae]GGE27600.1 peptidase M20 [Pullulanibacillus camelliae]
MDVIRTRRDLHQHPEVGFTEFRTASRVVEGLQSLGYDVLFGADALDEASRNGVPSQKELDQAYKRAIDDGANPEIISKMQGGLTAVIGILEGHAPGPTIAFRFDMDALPVHESTENDHFPQKQGFRSKYEQTMHACAHDAHTAIGLSLAEKMAEGSFSGKLKLIFQPAEEGGRGAHSVVKKGVVDDVDKIYCLHLGLDVPLGEISGGSKDWLATTKMMIEFFGVPSHSGASPEKGKNALIGAATALLNIHSLPRHSTEQTRINVGRLEGGSAVNIIPHYAKMVAETRSTSAMVNAELENKIKSIVKHSAEMHELQYNLEVIGQAIPITCDQELITLIKEEAAQIDDFTSVQDYHKGGGSEDASLLIKRVQELGGKGTYMIIGTTIPAPHHHQKFDIDEQVLEPTVKLLERISKRELV